MDKVAWCPVLLLPQSSLSGSPELLLHRKRVQREELLGVGEDRVWNLLRNLNCFRSKGLRLRELSAFMVRPLSNIFGRSGRFLMTGEKQVLLLLKVSALRIPRGASL